MTLLEAKETLQARIDERLNLLVPQKKGPHALLFEAARYSLLLPGKRLRPRLLLSVLEDHNIPLDKGMDAACAVEMIHTYSLIHDDLPCMDDDDLRRGKPTLHKVYGEGIATLAGDFLLTHAFQTLALSPFPKELITIFAKGSGGDGMIGGQVIDLLSENKAIDHDVLMQMYLGKTAALFAAALEGGALLSDLSYKEQATYRHAGNYFGIAFQIFDDILDITSDEETLGKPILSDQKKRKANAASLFGLEKAQEMAETFLEKALSALPPSASRTQALFRI